MPDADMGQLGKHDIGMGGETGCLAAVGLPVGPELHPDTKRRKINHLGLGNLLDMNDEHLS